MLGKINYNLKKHLWVALIFLFYNKHFVWLFCSLTVGFNNPGMCDQAPGWASASETDTTHCPDFCWWSTYEKTCHCSSSSVFTTTAGLYHFIILTHIIKSFHFQWIKFVLSFYFKLSPHFKIGLCVHPPLCNNVHPFKVLWLFDAGLSENRSEFQAC